MSTQEPLRDEKNLNDIMRKYFDEKRSVEVENQLESEWLEKNNINIDMAQLRADYQMSLEIKRRVDSKKVQAEKLDRAETSGLASSFRSLAERVDKKTKKLEQLLQKLELAQRLKKQEEQLFAAEETAEERSMFDQGFQVSQPKVEKERSQKQKPSTDLKKPDELGLDQKLKVKGSAGPEAHYGEDFAAVLARKSASLSALLAVDSRKAYEDKTTRDKSSLFNLRAIRRDKYTENRNMVLDFIKKGKTDILGNKGLTPNEKANALYNLLLDASEKIKKGFLKSTLQTIFDEEVKALKAVYPDVVQSRRKTAGLDNQKVAPEIDKKEIDALKERIKSAGDKESQESLQVQLFNLTPKDAIQSMFEKGEFESKAVAQFLKHPNLDRAKVGEYLSRLEAAGPKGEKGNNPKIVAADSVLSAYAETFQFSDKAFLPALREFLTSFDFAKESQVIERIQEAFTLSYLKQNPKTTLTNDSAYLLFSAVMMLNTSVVNPNVPAAMKRSKAQFVDQLKDGKKEIYPRAMLEGIYDEITKNPISALTVEQAKKPRSRP